VNTRGDFFFIKKRQDNVEGLWRRLIGTCGAIARRREGGRGLASVAGGGGGGSGGESAGRDVASVGASLGGLDAAGCFHGHPPLRCARAVRATSMLAMAAVPATLVSVSRHGDEVLLRALSFFVLGDFFGVNDQMDRVVAMLAMAAVPATLVSVSRHGAEVLLRALSFFVLGDFFGVNDQADRVVAGWGKRDGQLFINMW